MFCLSCKKTSPSGSVYCAHCPGSRCFNGVMCKQGHRCQVGTKTCHSCGSNEFSDHTWGLPTGWLAKAATIALLVYLWKVGLNHGSDVANCLWWGATQTFGFLTNSDSNALPNVLRTIGAYLFIGWIVGLYLSMLPGSFGKVGGFLRSLPAQAALFCVRGLPKLLMMLWRGVIQLSGLKPQKPTGGKDSGSGKAK